jgi:hypothetical protein
VQDLCRFNRFFMDKEEDAVIKLQALADRIAGAQGSENDAQELKAALVDFHGETPALWAGLWATRLLCWPQACAELFACWGWPHLPRPVSTLMGWSTGDCLCGDCVMGAWFMADVCAAVFSCAGEMVLLLHWSLLNYAAVVKILKKHGEGTSAPAGGRGGSKAAACRRSSSLVYLPQ